MSGMSGRNGADVCDVCEHDPIVRTIPAMDPQGVISCRVTLPVECETLGARPMRAAFVFPLFLARDEG
jgi:hypothetical protein